MGVSCRGTAMGNGDLEAQPAIKLEAMHDLALSLESERRLACHQACRCPRHRCNALA